MERGPLAPLSSVRAAAESTAFVSNSRPVEIDVHSVLLGGEHGGGSRRSPATPQPFPLPRVITRGLFATVRAHCRVNPSPTLAQP